MSIIVTIILLISASKCELNTEETKYHWYVENKTNHDVKSFLAFGLYSLGYIHIEYPDTVLPNWYGSTDSIGFNNIEPNEKQLVYASINTTWEDDVKKLSADTLSIYIFHSDTLRKYTWEQIREDYKILIRYDLSAEDITHLKDKYGIPVITYPPDERMKNMKMYPPYGE
jgi:hypothetical protein